MGKLEQFFKSEMVRLSKREMNRVWVPVKRDIRSLKKTVSQLRKTVLALEQFADRQRKQLAQEEAQLTAPPDTVKKSRFSPRLIRALRKRLGLSQRELAILSGVTVGAVHQWETGKFIPKEEKKGVLVALRKLGRREARRLLSSKTVAPSPKRPKRRATRKKYRK